MPLPLPQLAVVLGIFGTLLIAFLIGRRAGSRSHLDLPHLGIVQGGTLGLLGLLLGFAFSGATARFVERQDILVREANALGTAWLRADLLPEAARRDLRLLLRDYAQARLDLFAEIDPAATQDATARLVVLEQKLWAAAVRGVEQTPALAGVILAPLNEVFDLLSERNAASLRHLPLPVLGVLLACAALSVGSIGYGLATASPKLLPTAVALVFLIGAAIWVTIDLDYPRVGLIRVSDQPLRDTLADFTRQLSPVP